MKSIFAVVQTICKNHRLIFDLARNDFKARYSYSLLGTIWAFIQPLITILVFWFVFQMGFKSAPINDIPYILWFIPAYIPWIFFGDILNSSAGCMQEYNYLVKKVRFDVEILPAVKIVSSSFVHLFFIGFIFVIFVLYGAPLSVFTLQALYYTLALTFLGFGLSMLISSVTVLFKDFVQIVNIFLQVGFWSIPIFWNPETMEPWVLLILKLNPMYYIVNGYRDSFIYNIPFWRHPVYSTYFWCFSLFIFITGCLLFLKLRPHFADEL